MFLCVSSRQETFGVDEVTKLFNRRRNLYIYKTNPLWKINMSYMSHVTHLLLEKNFLFLNTLLIFLWKLNCIKNLQQIPLTSYLCLLSFSQWSYFIASRLCSHSQSSFALSLTNTNQPHCERTAYEKKLKINEEWVCERSKLAIL